MSVDGTELSTSVLITTYNGERFIEEQLDSIRQQTKPVDQVLIFDDGSSDSTAEVVTGFIERHGLVGWSFTINPENLGPADNTLQHLTHLTGDLVFLADQDDRWEPTKVEVLARYMAHDDGLTLAVSRTNVIDAQGKTRNDALVRREVLSGSRLHRGPADEVQELGFNDFLGYSSVPLHAMCVRGDVLREMGAEGEFPRLSQSIGADWLIGIVCAALGRCILVPEVLMSRRVHGANISLGRLHKTMALSATQERRLTMLRETQQAHDFLVTNEALASRLTQEHRSRLDNVRAFIGRRIRFAEDPTILRSLRLLRALRWYYVSAGTFRRTIRMWLADVMYAYNINWKLKRRDAHG